MPETNAELLIGPFKWRRNAVIFTVGIGVGLALWVYGSTDPVYLQGLGDLFELAGGLTVLSALLAGAINLLIPYLDRRSAEHALLVGIDKHRLVVRGVGKLAHVTQEWDLNDKTTFSDPDVLIASGERLRIALEKALKTYGGALAPTIIIMPFWRRRPFQLRPAERYVVNEAARMSQALNAFVIDPGHPLFDTTLMSENLRNECEKASLAGAMA